MKDIFLWLGIENISSIEWRMLDEPSVKVLGYDCMVAECNYKGRKWLAWYTIEIPYRYGVWELGGLPRIILKAEDSHKLFQWEAVGIEKGKGQKIYRCTENQKEVDNKDMAKLWQRMWCAPHTMRYLFETDRELEVMLPNGQWKTIRIDMTLAKRYYPKFEL